MSVKQMALSTDDLRIYEQMAALVQPPLRGPLPIVVWADTGAYAFQRARAGSAQMLALSAQWLGTHEAERAELMYSALMWMYHADQPRMKAPPASRVTPLTRREHWASDLPEHLQQLYATMPVCEHCERTIHTGKPHKSCEAFQTKMEARIAKLERELERARQAAAALELLEGQSAASHGQSDD